MKEPPRKIAASIRKLYSARNELRRAFPNLPFTLDGKLVGDIGEAIAIAEFGLTKLGEGAKLHDCRAPSGKLVQVKATQQTAPGKSVGLGREKQSFDHLLVIQIFENGKYSVLYDGPGRYIDRAWADKSFASLSVLQLKRLNTEVKPREKLLDT